MKTGFSILILVFTSCVLVAQGAVMPIGDLYRLNFDGYPDHNNISLLSSDIPYPIIKMPSKFQYQNSFVDRSNWNLGVLSQPSYGTADFRPIDDISYEVNGYETGLNVGMQFRKQMPNEDIHFYTMVSSGSHYVLTEPLRQADEFVLSSNMFIGTNMKLSGKSYLDLRTGFRHISSTGLTGPNGDTSNLIAQGRLFITL